MSDIRKGEGKCPRLFWPFSPATAHGTAVGGHHTPCVKPLFEKAVPPTKNRKGGFRLDGGCVANLWVRECERLFFSRGKE